MSDETLKKPSDDLTERMAKLLEVDAKAGHPNLSRHAGHVARVVALFGGNVLDSERALGMDGKTIEGRRYGLLFLALAEHLDSEAERRATWEAKVDEHLVSGDTIRALLHFRNATVRAFPALIPLIEQEMRSATYEVRHVYAGHVRPENPPANFKVDADEPEVKP